MRIVAADHRDGWLLAGTVPGQEPIAAKTCRGRMVYPGGVPAGRMEPIQRLGR